MMDLEQNLPVLADIQNERERQDRKWGPQNHEFPIWVPILLEEIGEASKEFLKKTFAAYEAEGAKQEGQKPDTITPTERGIRFRKELIESAAVLVAMIECGDRNGWFQERRISHRRLGSRSPGIGRRLSKRRRT